MAVSGVVRSQGGGMHFAGNAEMRCGLLFC